MVKGMQNIAMNALLVKSSLLITCFLKKQTNAIHFISFERTGFSLKAEVLSTISHPIIETVHLLTIYVTMG